MSSAAPAQPERAEAEAGPSLTTLVSWALGGTRGLVTLLVTWCALFLLQTQIPSLRAAAWAGDGLARADAALLRALSLDDLGGSAPLWLALGISVLIGAANARQLARRPAVLVAALGLIGSGASFVWDATASVPLRFEAVLDGSRAQIFGLEAGRWERAAGPDLRCRPSADGLACTLDGAAVAVSAGQVASTAVGALRWVGATTSIAAAAGRLEVPASSDGWVGFELDAERATLVPALQRRVAAVPTPRSGPLLSSAREGEDALRLGVATPASGAGPVFGRLRRTGLVALRLDRPGSGWLGTIALCIGLLGLFFAVPRRTPVVSGGADVA